MWVTSKHGEVAVATFRSYGASVCCRAYSFPDTQWNQCCLQWPMRNAILLKTTEPPKQKKRVDREKLT
jgi:hypothetical protein